MPDDPPRGFDPARSIAAVEFEYSMAVQTATRAHPILRTSLSASDDDDFYAAVAFVESFFVHASCLDEFLSSRGNFPTDIKASHFVSGFSEAPLDADLLDSVNRALHHITVERQEGHIPWVPMQHLQPIAESMGRFIDQLEVENPDLASRLTSIQDNALETLASPPPPKSTGISTTTPWFLYTPPGAEGNHHANENPR